MSTSIKINPEKATIYLAGGDDNIISGLQLETDPNGLLLRIRPGRVRINSLFFDILNTMETNCSNAPMGRSLVALTQTLNLVFLDDNIPADHLVIGVSDKKNIGTSLQVYITQIEYFIGEAAVTAPGDVFAPTVSMETQLRMLFEELSINKDRDNQLRYEEILESLPQEFNTAFVESFEAGTYFVTNELVYNAYSHIISLGILPPYSTDPKILVEKVTLDNPIDTGYLSIDFIDNGQMMNARISFDDGVTWMTYTGDDYYSAGVGSDIVIEFTLQTSFTNTSPQIRSWALFYNKLP